MLAEGSGQGVLDCKRAETDYPQASPGAHKLMEELCAFQTGAEQASEPQTGTPDETPSGRE